MTDPCKDCSIRKKLERRFDIHIWGEDCFYDCEKYEAYKAAQKAKEEDHGRPGEGD